MPVPKELLRTIPKVDELLTLPALRDLPAEIPHSAVIEAVRAELDAVRGGILDGTQTEAPRAEELARRLSERIRAGERRRLRHVVNATGVILHTNLGRANLSVRAARAAYEAGAGYSTLEYNLETGERGSRYAHVEGLICALTGAESAMVVNNNAAAVLLILGTMAKGREVIVSRGELVEIGGSFRVPDIMQMSGCILREVGTTNKVRAGDYEAAIQPGATGALLKVHTSNFKILGFTEEVSVAALSELGRRHGLPVIHDLGSGALFPFDRFGVQGEPHVQQSVTEGADVISFSGDKLLGGPQAGIIIGAKRYIDAMKKNPLTRALRVDKMTLAALEETLLHYRDPESAAAEIPSLRMLAAGVDELQARARELCDVILREAPGVAAELQPDECQVGGGSVPTQLLPGWAVNLSVDGLSETELEERMRLSDPPVIGRISKGRYLLNLRTMLPEEFPAVARNVRLAAGSR